MDTAFFVCLFLKVYIEYSVKFYITNIITTIYEIREINQNKIAQNRLCDLLFINFLFQ